MQKLITVKKTAQAEFLEKKSRFIGYVNRASDEEEAQKFIKIIQNKHKDATHNVYAYQCGLHNEMQRSTDAGEPSGTAGRPILETIKNKNLNNTVIVVTRYFGGIMLGAGGLVRAYSKAASMAIDAAGCIAKLQALGYSITFKYPHLAQIENYLRAKQYPIQESTYTDLVNLQCLVPKADEDDFKNTLTELTAGDVNFNFLGDDFWLEKDL